MHLFDTGVISTALLLPVYCVGRYRRARNGRVMPAVTSQMLTKQSELLTPLLRGPGGISSKFV